MSESYTESHANTFTITNAKYLASKVETDLMRLHRYYYQSHGRPTLREIKNYHDELVLLQKFNFLDKIEYGFVHNNAWVKALRYTARQGGVLTADDDPGGISCPAIPTNAAFSSLLWYNNRWNSAIDERKDFKRQTPVLRETEANYLGDWTQERAYSSGGRGLLRAGI